MHSTLLLSKIRVALVVAACSIACGGQSTKIGGSGSGGTSGAGGSSTSGGTSGSTSASGGDAGSGGSGQGGSGQGGSGGAKPDRCLQPLESGPCNAYFPAYGFSIASGRCEHFVYGGCGGNDNRFATLGECIAECDPGALECERDADCAVAAKGCCGPCEPVQTSMLKTVPAKYSDVSECRDVVCGACVAYPGTPQLPLFDARCNAGSCELFDTRGDFLDACEVDEDCTLRNGLDCCEYCGGEYWVAVNRSPEVLQRICPEPTDCDPCVPPTPPGLVARCSEGLCQVAAGP